MAWLEFWFFFQLDEVDLYLEELREMVLQKCRCVLILDFGKLIIMLVKLSKGNLVHPHCI